MAFPIRKLLIVSLLSALGSAGALAAEQSHFEHFITRDGAALKDGDRLFRFAGIHAPELHRIEDDARGTCKADPRGWGQYFKWPTAEEQENWIKARVLKHSACMCYPFSRKTTRPADVKRISCHRKRLTACRG